MKKIDKNKVINLVIILISFFSTYFLQYVINFEGEITYSNSILSVAVFSTFIILLKKTWIKDNIQKIKSAAFLGVVFSTFLVLGNSIDTNSTVEYGNIQIYLAIIFMSVIVNAVLVQLYKLFEKFELRNDKEGKFKLSENKKQLLIFLFILICWIPVFLAAYPGYFCYDAYDEYIFYVLDNLNSWQPIIHNVILGFIIANMANVFQNFNIAIAIYTALQMIVVLGVFMYCLSFLEKYNTSKVIRIISVLYYALFPVVVMFALCSTKDTLFSAIMLVGIIITIKALLNKEKFLNSKIEQLKFAVIMFLAIVFRNNAIYAYIPFLAIFIITFKNKKVLIPIVEIVIFYLIYNIIIFGVLNIYRIKLAEAFSVPLQQIARVYNYNYESLTEEELELIYEYTTDEELKSYIPECSDPIKKDVYLGDMGYGRFFKLWFQIGIKNVRNIHRFIFGEYTSILVSRYNNRRI